MTVVEIYGSLNFFVNLFTLFVSSSVLVIIVRTPLKRNYHYTFMLFVASLIWYGLIGTIYQGTGSPEVMYAIDPIQTLANAPLSMALLYLFVLQLTTREFKLWQKVAALGGFGYGAVYALTNVLDESFMFSGSHRVPAGLGIINTPGGLVDRTTPYGVNIPLTFGVLLILFAVVASFRASRSPLTRRQLTYLAAAAVFFYLSGTGGAPWVADLLSLVSPYATGSLQLFRAATVVTLLVGFTRHGFYQVKPIAEISTTAPLIPRRYSLLEDGRSYLTQDPKTSFEVFSELVMNGHNGLCITRVFPDDVRRDYRLETTPIRWLAEEKNPDAIPPTDLLGLSLTVKDFYQRAERPAVMIQGIEYLITLNGFKPILRLLQILREVNSSKRGIIVLSILPKSLEERNHALIASETTPLPEALESRKT